MGIDYKRSCCCFCCCWWLVPACFDIYWNSLSSPSSFLHSSSLNARSGTYHFVHFTFSSTLGYFWCRLITVSVADFFNFRLLTSSLLSSCSACLFGQLLHSSACPILEIGQQGSHTQWHMSIITYQRRKLYQDSRSQHPKSGGKRQEKLRFKIKKNLQVLCDLIGNGKMSFL